MIHSSAHASLQLETHQLVNLGRKLERQLVKHVPAEPTNNHAHSLLSLNPPLLEVEQLVLPDFRGTGLVLNTGGRILDLQSEMLEISTIALTTRSGRATKHQTTKTKNQQFLGRFVQQGFEIYNGSSQSPPNSAFARSTRESSAAFLIPAA
jgi:hypothetical protein